MNYYDNNDNLFKLVKTFICVAGVLIILVFTLMLWGCPQYNVWHAEMAGKAQLAEAEYSKQILIQEANANLEAEKLNAEAEVVRAQGTADARNVEGFGMTNEEYIQYLWVKKLGMADTSVIYLPSEGGIPVLTLSADANADVSVEGTKNADD